MKTHKTFLMASIAALLFACGETSVEKQGKETNDPPSPGNGMSNANTVSGNNRETKDGKNNSSYNDVPRPDSETATISEEVNTATTPNFNNASNSDGTRATNDIVQPRQDRLYKDLNMTDAQINEYENAIRNATNRWEKDNPDQTMTSKNKQVIERASLQSVLDDAQFKSYGKWAQSNPYID